MSYQGWANWETWNVELYLGNEEPLYRAKMEFIRLTPNLTAENVKSFCFSMFPHGTPDMRHEYKMNRVNYEELAEHWREERKEMRLDDVHTL